MAMGRCGLFVFVLYSGSSSVVGERIDFQKVIRGQGHVHVTRLQRNDHSGLEALLEAEARWHAGQPSSLFQERYLQLSQPQLDWLREHHKRTSLVEMGSTALIRHSLRSIHKHASRTGVMHAAQANTSGEIPTTMLSSLDSQYVGPLSIGTVTRPEGCKSSMVQLQYVPHSRFDAKSDACHAEEQSEVFVVFDTGSTNLWVSSDLCTSGGCAASDRNRYNHSLSQTYADPEAPVDLHVQFGTGSLNGPVGVDDLHVGPFTVYNQSFAMIKSAEGAVFESLPLEGILGLAFPAMAANGSQPFFDTVIKQKALKNNQFAFYFSLSNPSANAIFWGDVDNSFHEGPITYHKVTDPYYWSVDLLSFQIGDQELLGDGSHGQKEATSVLQTGEFAIPKAIVDTGTTFFTAGGELYRKIMNAIPSDSCSKVTEKSHPPILFRLRDVEGQVVDYKLTNEQYMASSSEHCSPAFMNIDIPAKHGPGMILGEVFLRHYLAVFDRGDGKPENGRVGFAKAVHGDPVDKRLKELTHNQATFAEARHRTK